MADEFIYRLMKDILADMQAVVDHLYAQLPELGPLTYSIVSIRAGSLLTAELIGAVAGSIFSGVGLDGTKIDPQTGVMEGKPTQAGEFDLIVTETNARAKNSPRSTTIRFNVLPAVVTPPAPRRWTADSTFIRADGTNWTADGTVKGGAIGRAFFSDPFFSDPFFRDGTAPRTFFSDPFFADPFFRTGA